MAGRPHRGCRAPAQTRRDLKDGGPAPLHSYLSAAGRTVTGTTPIKPWVTPDAPIATPWVSTPGLLTARCTTNQHATFLEVTVNGDPTDPRVDDIVGDLGLPGKPVPNWGLHLVDVNISMGNLLDIVGQQAQAYSGREVARKDLPDFNLGDSSVGTSTRARCRRASPIAPSAGRSWPAGLDGRRRERNARARAGRSAARRRRRQRRPLRHPVWRGQGPRPGSGRGPCPAGCRRVRRRAVARRRPTGLGRCRRRRAHARPELQPRSALVARSIRRRRSRGTCFAFWQGGSAATTRCSVQRASNGSVSSIWRWSTT